MWVRLNVAIGNQTKVRFAVRESKLEIRWSSQAMVSKIWSAVLVHTNGRGSWFQVSTHDWIEPLSSATEG
jgi:hypothetical protein